MNRKFGVLGGILVILLLAGCGAAIWSLSRLQSPGPMYGGLSLSEWLRTYDSQNIPREQVDAAVVAMGTNAVPLLLDWLGAWDSLRKRKLILLIQRQSIVNYTYTFAEDRQRLAKLGIKALRPCADDIVPVLVATYTQENRSGREPADSFVVLSALGYLEKPSHETVNLLLAEMSNTNGWVRQTAIWALGRVHPAPEVAVPALIRSLRDTDPRARGVAASAFHDYGKDAKAAIPYLVELADEESRLINTDLAQRDAHREAEGAAEYALEWIRATCDPEPVVNKLIQELDFRDWHGRIDAAHKLGRFGPAAKAAIPKLRQMFDEEEKALQRVPSSHDHQIMYETLSAALAAIEQEVAPPR